MAGGLVGLWLAAASSGLAVAATGARESCCRSRKSCCCRSGDGKSGWKAAGGAQKCPRTCETAVAPAGKSSGAPVGNWALQAPRPALGVRGEAAPQASPAAEREHRGRAPPLA